MLDVIRRKLLTWAMPVTKDLGKVHAPFSHKGISGMHYMDLKTKLVPGQVLLTRTEGEMTTMLIPGFWSHGAIYVGDGWVIEAVGAGVVKTDLVSFMMTKDVMSVCSPLFATTAQRLAAVAWATRQLGTPYDYDFRSDNKAFYCFELTYAAYQEATGRASPWKLRQTMGVDTVVGDDFEKAKDKWLFGWDSRQMSAGRDAGGIPYLAFNGTTQLEVQVA
jgi:uncharacterized protein YycO